MMKLKFVVAGTGRSGTAYIARLLTAAGVPTGHERWFTWVPGIGDRQTIDRTGCGRGKAWPSRLKEEIRRRRQPIMGDASWLAVPRLDRFDGRVFLQVRDPLAVIASYVAMRFFDFSAVQKKSVWQVFALQHFDPTGDSVVDAARWWVTWNQRALRFADRWWRLEDLDEAELASILTQLDIPDASQRAAGAFAQVDRTNTAEQRGHGRAGLTWGDIHADVRMEVTELALFFGYPVPPKPCNSFWTSSKRNPY